MTARCWVFDETIDTDVLAPGQYIKQPIEILAAHCLESVRGDFAGTVTAGDVIVAGRNFGVGSSREQAAQALKVLGVAGIVAESFGGIFFRNAINLGLPVMTPVEPGQLLSLFSDGDQVELDVFGARLEKPAQQIEVYLQPMPEFLANLIKAGGLVNVLRERFQASAE